MKVSMIMLGLTILAGFFSQQTFAQDPSCSIDIKSESVKFADAYHIQRIRDLYSKLDAALTSEDRAFFFRNDEARLAQWALRSRIDSKMHLAPGDDKAYRTAGATLDRLKAEANARIRTIVEKTQLLKLDPKNSQGYVDPVTGLAIQLYEDETQLETARKENKLVGPSSKIPLVQMEVSYPFSGKEGEMDRVFVPALYTADIHSMRLNVEDNDDDRGDTIHDIRDIADALYVRAEAKQGGCVAPDRTAADRIRDGQVVNEAIGDRLEKDVYVASQRYPITDLAPSGAAQ